MLQIGNKIKYVKVNPSFGIPIGTVLTVVDVQGVAIAMVGDYKVEGTKVGEIKAVMSYDEYEKYFEMYTEEKSEYTEWKKFDFCEHTKCESCLYPLMCYCRDDSKVQYKHNNKKVVVKFEIPKNQASMFPNGKVFRGYASCSPEDKFDLMLGIRIAMQRIEKQLAQHLIQKTDKDIANI